MRRVPFALVVSAALSCAALSPAQQAVETKGSHSDSQSAMVPSPVVTPIARSIFITIPEALEPIKRAPVVFWHDKHTEALKTEGCEVCHAKDGNKFDFAFPKTTNEKTRGALTESFHDACITCHASRASAHKSFGPVTCGECHADKKAFQKQEYRPVLPSQYDALKDPYHKDCAACHLKPTRSAAEVEELDWKTFYVQAQKRIIQKWPEVGYDYITHDKHVKALENRCELCHYISPALKDKLAAQGRKPSSQDWLREDEPGRNLKDKKSA
ncbi:MAG: cytochrome c3 family protein, partial [bacterium]